jgi:ligand-binding SRPBCC domain-containing protein
MPRFQSSTLIPAEVGDVYGFHIHPSNLAYVSPPGVQVRRIVAPVKLEKGCIVEVHAQLYRLIPSHWTVQVVEMVPDLRFVDLALKSPFALWRHEHRFEPAPGGCQMTDIVDWEVPGGFLGRWFGRPFAAAEIRKIFRHRHRLTREWFERRNPVR